MNDRNKRTGLIITSIVIIVLFGAAIITGAVSKGNRGENTNYNGIAAFSNLNSFDNDGFNNGVKKGYENYIGNYKDDNEYIKAGKGKSRIKKDFKTSFYSDDGRQYVDMLNELYVENDMIISAGFQVANAISGTADFTGVFEQDYWKKHNKDEEKAFILLDDTSLAASYENTASVNFAAEGAGYLSALSAGIYTEWDVKENNKTNANIVMWGGMAFPTVFDYMSGFAQGIKDFNTNFSSTIPDFKEITLWNGGSAQGDIPEGANESLSYDKTSETDQADKDKWYTFGFDAAEGVPNGDLAKIKSNNALAYDASIIFPIAGGNTTIAEQAISSSKDSSTKLVGVDSDATLASAHDEMYIGSAQKNLIKGGEIALWAMDDYDGDGIRNAQETTPLTDESSVELKAEYDLWNSTTPAKGVQLEGSIDNGGVGFLYANATKDHELVSAPSEIFIKILGEYYGIDPKADNFEQQVKAKYDEELSNWASAAGTINDADSKFQ